MMNKKRLNDKSLSVKLSDKTHNWTSCELAEFYGFESKNLFLEYIEASFSKSAFRRIKNQLDANDSFDKKVKRKNKTNSSNSPEEMEKAEEKPNQESTVELVDNVVEFYSDTTESLVEKLNSNIEELSSIKKQLTELDEKRRYNQNEQNNFKEFWRNILEKVQQAREKSQLLIQQQETINQQIEENEEYIRLISQENVEIQEKIEEQKHMVAIYCGMKPVNNMIAISDISSEKLPIKDIIIQLLLRNDIDGLKDISVAELEDIAKYIAIYNEMKAKIPDKKIKLVFDEENNLTALLNHFIDNSIMIQ